MSCGLSSVTYVFLLSPEYPVSYSVFTHFWIEQRFRLPGSTWKTRLIKSVLDAVCIALLSATSLSLLYKIVVDSLDPLTNVLFALLPAPTSVSWPKSV
jgi:hypothetical protein